MNQKRTKLKIILRRRMVLKAIIIAIEVVLISVLLNRSPFFYTKDILVEGNSILTKDKIIFLSEVSRGDNLFKIKKSSVKKNIMQEPYVKDLQVKKKFPRTLIIYVEERTPKAEINIFEEKLILDDQLNILEKNRSRDGTVELKNFIDRIPENNQDLKDMIKEKKLNVFLDNLFKFENKNFKEIELNGQEITITCDNNREILFGEYYDSEYKFSLLEEIIKDIETRGLEFDTIDMTRGKYPILRIRDQGVENEE